MKRFIFSLLAMVALVSCVNDATDDSVVNIGGEDCIYARIEKIDSRVQMDNHAQMVWSVDDELHVVGPATHKRYKYNGETADGATFVLRQTYTPFEREFDKYYAVSPFGTHSSGEEMYMYSESPGTRIQSYMPNSSDVEMNTVYGTSNDGVNFEFINLLGYLRIPIAGEKVVKSLEITSNAGEIIASKYRFLIENPYELENYQNQSSTILLDCGEGVQLSATPTDFYFAVLPTTMTEGFALTIKFADGISVVQKTINPIEIKRNVISPMAVFDTSDESYQKVKVTHSNNTFNFPTIMGVTTISGYVDWGDNNVSVFDESITNYTYNDNKTTHTVTIKVKNADVIDFFTCEGISELDISKF